MLTLVDEEDSAAAQAWDREIGKLDWQPVDGSHKDGRALVVRNAEIPYVYAYWGPNQEDWGWPESHDDSVLQWRLAGDCRVGQPFTYDVLEAAEPTDVVCNALGEY